MAPRISFWRLIRRLGKIPELLDAVRDLYEYVEGMSMNPKLAKKIKLVRRLVESIIG